MRSRDDPRTTRSRSLRRNSTDAELALWRQIRNRQLDGFKFVRQEPIDRYYVDFVCRDRRLIVELDGGQHAESVSDRERDARLAAQGYRIIRFWNNEVLGNIEGVLEVLRMELDAAPHPDPLPAGGERGRSGDAGYTRPPLR